MNKVTHSYIAIDVSKDSLQVQTDDTNFCVRYNQSGLNKIAKIAQKQKNALIVFEATGGYEVMLKDYFQQLQILTHLASASKVRYFASSEGVRAKTDRIDAKMLYHYAMEKKLEPQKPNHPAQRELALRMDRRDQLVEERKRERSRLDPLPSSSLIVKSIKRNLRHLDKEIQQIEAEIEKWINQNQELKNLSDELLKIKGVGIWTSCSILAYLGEIAWLKRGQLSALVGLAPYNKDSGKHSGKRRIIGGRGKVRKVLFMAAKAASHSNPVIKEYMKRLKLKGKPWKVALTAAMRKLLLHIQSVVKRYESSIA